MHGFYFCATQNSKLKIRSEIDILDLIENKMCVITGEALA